MDLPFGETRNPKFFNIVRKKKTDKEIVPAKTVFGPYIIHGSANVRFR